HVDEVGPRRQAAAHGAVLHEGVAGGEDDGLGRIEHHLPHDRLPDEGREVVVVDVVLDHATDAVDAGQAVSQRAGGADVEHPGGATLGDGGGGGHGGGDLADARQHDVDVGEVGRLLAHRDHDEETARRHRQL